MSSFLSVGIQIQHGHYIGYRIDQFHESKKKEILKIISFVFEIDKIFKIDMFQ